MRAVYLPNRPRATGDAGRVRVLRVKLKRPEPQSLRFDNHDLAAKPLIELCCHLEDRRLATHGHGQGRPGVVFGDVRTVVDDSRETEAAAPAREQLTVIRAPQITGFGHHDLRVAMNGADIVRRGLRLRQATCVASAASSGSPASARKRSIALVLRASASSSGGASA